MKSKQKNDVDGKVSSLTEKIGVSVIGLLTIVGVGLIIYTGVQATTYVPETSDKDYLILEDTEVKPNENETDNESQLPEPEAPVTDEGQADKVETEAPITPQDPQTNPEEPKQPETPQQPQVLEAICNIDGVNVRQEPKTGTEIIGNLIAGDKVTVVNRDYSEEWVEISFEGKTGYVYREYLDFN